MTFVALALLVMMTAATLDYSHARYVQAISAKPRRRHEASRWSVAAWMAGSVCFVVAVKASIWVLPFEAVGLYAGTWIGSREVDRS